MDDYKGVIDDSLFDELKVLSERLKDARVCFINATAYGGGVAEILHKEIPLAKSLGLKFTWKVVSAGPEFFDVTKKIHNGLQGADVDISEHEWKTYGACNLHLSKTLNVSDYDIVYVHDPQPAEIISCLGKNHAKWIWRCHIDTSEPNQQVADYFLKFTHAYDASVFTMRDYVLKGMGGDIFIVPPAIDPLSDKNRAISREEIRKIVAKFGIDTARPLITQVSRFDPWKDPKGVVDAYRIVREKVPDLQLVLAGSMADDDPEAQRIYEDVKTYAEGHPDVHLLTNHESLNDLEVNAFQAFSDVVIQKSIKEGFGLTVSEALWKETPVIGGNVGGIPTQITDGETGFLVNSVGECAERMVYLLSNKEAAATMGRRGKEVVRQKFLLPRLLRDELKVIENLVK